MAGKHDKRIAKVEQSLTPKQAVLRWMQEALGHPSFDTLARSYVGKPVAEYPLSVLGQQMEAAVRTAHKGEKRDLVYRAIERAQRDVVFLWKLFMHANGRVDDQRQPFSLAALLMQERLHGLVERLFLHHEMWWAWHQVCERLPYPLDRETVPAVQAAINHYVEPWEQFEESGMVQDWVTDAYVAEGKTALPLWSYYAKGDHPAPVGIEVPTQEDTRVLFKGEDDFQQWLQGEDYRYGLADVPDAEFEARCEAAEAAVRALVDRDSVAQG